MLTLAKQSSISKWRHLLIGVVLTMLSISTNAHQQKLSYTSITHNSHTNNIEVMHRFLLHDAEHAVKKLFNKNADVIADATTRKQFATYVENKFHLKLFPTTSETLQMIGSEIDGSYLWIYQEMTMPETIHEVAISHSTLREIWSDQINRVNIELNENTETLIFTAHSPAQQILTLD